VGGTANVQQSVPSNRYEPVPQPKGIRNTIGYMLVGGTTKFGKIMGETMGASRASRTLARTPEDEERYRIALETIKRNKAAGRDTSKSEQLLRESLYSDVKQFEETNPVLKATTGQVVGAGLEMGAEALLNFGNPAGVMKGSFGITGKSTPLLAKGPLSALTKKAATNPFVASVAKSPIVQKLATPLAKSSAYGAGVGAVYDTAAYLENPEQGFNPYATVAGAVLPPAFALAGKAAMTGGRMVKETVLPSNIMNRVARMNPSDAQKFQKMSGKTPGQYLTETGNFGTPEEIIQREHAKHTASKQSVDDTIANIPGNYKNRAVTTALTDLAEREVRVSAPGAPSRDAARVAQLVQKDATEGLTMAEINEVKRLYERNVKTGYLRENNTDGVARATNIDSAIRNWQVGEAAKAGFTNLEEMNKQTQLAKFIVDKLGKKIMAQAGNNAITLTDWIMLSGGNIQNVAGLFAKKFFSSKKVQSTIARGLAAGKTKTPFIRPKTQKPYQSNQARTATERINNTKNPIFPPTILPQVPPRKPSVPQERKLLPAPSNAMPMGGIDAQGRRIDAQGNLILPPQPKNPARVVPAKKMSYKDKKTGKFKRGWTSESGKAMNRAVIGGAAGSQAGWERGEDGKWRYNVKKGLAGLVGGAVIGAKAKKGLAGMSIEDINKKIPDIKSKRELIQYAESQSVIIPRDKIRMSDDLRQAAKDVKKGQKTMSELPLLVKRNSDGTFDIIDGNHRYVEKVVAGRGDILGIEDEALYRKLAEKEDEFRTVVKAHERGGTSGVRTYQRERKLGSVTPDKKKVNSSISTDLTTSIQKAKASGQSFDEWVKGQGEPLYHQTSAVFDKFDTAKSADGSIWFTNNFDDITNKSRGTGASSRGRVVESFATKDLKLATPEQFDSKFTDQLIQEGYDGVYYPGDETTGAFYQIFKPEKLKTRSQLKAEWDKVGGLGKLAPTENLEDAKEALRKAKGLSASDIMSKYPDINLKRDVAITDVRGQKKVIPEGEALTPYELKGNKVLLQDGETYIVSKNQWQNIKGNALSGEAKEFAPELKGTEETILGVAQKNAQTEKNKIFAEYDAGKITKQERDNLLDKWTPRNTKYDQYTLPGGENYKEILIKAPTTPVYNVYNAANSMVKSNLSKEVAQTEAEKIGGHIQKTVAHDTTNFKSSHWDELNVLAHLRMNWRKYKGKAVAFLEELQSDWAREGRSKGFAMSVEDRYEIFQDVNGYYRARDKHTGQVKSRLIAEDGEEYSALSTKERVLDALKRHETFAEKGIPNNPLLKNWQTLSVKRALKEAVDSDAEYFAWINGDQTSARYNLATYLKDVNWESSLTPEEAALRKKLDSMDYGRLSQKQKDSLDKLDQRFIAPFGSKRIKINPEKGSMNDIVVDKNGIITSTSNDFKGKKLDEVLGKGLADSIMSKDSGTLSGEGLKFGGEWANNLYDKQVKAIVEDLTGGKVEMLDLGLPIDTKENIQFRPVNERGVHTSRNLLPSMLKTGMEIEGSKNGVWGDYYIITDILGDGKFKAVPAETKKYKVGTIVDDYHFANQRLLDQQVNSMKETFDISTKTTVQQGIKITDAIRAKILGQAPPLKKPSGVSPLGKIMIK
jgi:hypothetical protein